MEIIFSVNGEIQLARNLRVLSNRISNMEGFFKESVEIVEKRSDDLFKAHGKNVQKNPLLD